MYWFVAEWNDKVKTYEVLSSDCIIDGNIRLRKPTDNVSEKVLIVFKKKKYLVRIIGTGTKQEMLHLCDSTTEKEAAEEALKRNVSIQSRLRRTAKSSNKPPGLPKETIRSLSLIKRKNMTSRLNSSVTSTVVCESNVAGTLENHGVGPSSAKETVVKRRKETAQEIPKLSGTASITEPDAPEGPSDAVGIVDCIEDSDTTNYIDHTNCVPKEKYKDRVKSLKKEMKSVRREFMNEKDRLVEKLKSTKQKLDRMKKKMNEQNQMELVPNSGVFMEKAKVEAALVMSNSPSTLARTLFKKLFTVEEILGHSLLGKVCNANRHLILDGNELRALPEIDPGRRDAIIRFALESYGHDGRRLSRMQEYKRMKSEVKASLSKLMREISLKAAQDGD